MTTHLTRVVLLIVCLSLFITGSVSAQQTDYGAPLGSQADKAESVRLGDLMEQPDRYIDKLVRVEGLVDDVCPMKGCWISILEEQSQTTVRFKVEDDVIVFPAEAKGEQVVAEGILRARHLDEEAARRWFKHLADEKGEAFDESSVTGPTTVYEIEGVGARVGKS